MKRVIITACTAALAVLFVFISSPPSTAQGLSPQGGTIVGATAGGGLEKNASKLGLKTSCSSSQVLAWDGDSWECAASGGGGGGTGTVTSVGTSAPLSGGPITTTGTVSLLTCAANQVYKMNGAGTAWACNADGDTTYTAGTSLQLTGTTFSLNIGSPPSCGAGSFVSAYTATGAATCTAETGDISGLTSTSPMALGGTQGGSCASGSCAVALLAANTSRFFGRITAGAGNAEELTGTQATTLLDAFTSALKGLVPASGGGTSNYLRADGSWAVPPGTTTISGLTANAVIKAASSTTIANGSATDTGSLWSFTTPQTYADSSTRTADATLDGTLFTGSMNVGAANRTLIGKRGSAISSCTGTCTPNAMRGIGVQGDASIGGYASNFGIGVYGTTNAGAPTYPSGAGSIASAFDGLAAFKSGLQDFSGNALSAIACSTNGNVPTYSGGSWTCATPASISGLTTNTIPKASSSTAIANSLLTDNGTTLSYNGGTMTVTAATGAISASGNIVSTTGNINANSGSMTASGAITGGALATIGTTAGHGVYVGTNSDVYIEAATPASSGSVNFLYSTNAAGDGWINYAGFNGGVTQFRNTKIGDGKGAVAVTVTGSSKQVDFNGLAAFGASIQYGNGSRPFVKGLAPTLTSCGTSPTVLGDTHAGHVTTGTGATGCSITLSFTSANPTCIVESRSSAAKAFGYSVSSTTLAITTASASTTYDWICVDHY